MKKVIIIGGVAGGASTAARLRRRNENAEIILFERGEYISYANCGLPYYIGETIADRDKLFVQTPESFGKRFRVDVRIRQNVTGINRAKKVIEVHNLQTGETYSESYDKLVLSPGAEPVKPPIPGINLPGIFTLRNVPDTDRIKEYVDEVQPRRAVIVGAGFIGLEMAENLHKRGVFVTIVEMADQVMTPLDYEMAAAVHQHLKTKNVEFYLKDAVSSFAQNDDKLVVRLDSTRELDTDMIILSIGVRPETKLIRDAGLKVGDAGGIVVDEHLCTDDPNIYAVGDAIEFPNPVIGKPTIAYLAGPSNKQGRIAADNIIDDNTHSYPGTIATAIAKVFDLTVASTGISEKRLREENIPYKASIIHGSSHAGYYPDAYPMTIKLQFSATDGKLFGAQIVGYEGVDKRIDLIATVLKSGGTVADLTEIEHAYAPPFSSAKDPVNIAGFAAENILLGMVDIVHWYEVVNRRDGEDILLDVRTRDEYDLGHIENSVHIPLDDLRDRLDELPRENRILVYCAAGLRGYVASRILMQNGFEKVANLSGGYKTFEHATQKQSNEDIYHEIFINKDDVLYSSDPEQKDAEPDVQIAKEVDATGLQCPGPIMKLKSELESLTPGEVIQTTASDPGFENDVKAWCKMTGNSLLRLERQNGNIVASVKKSSREAGFQTVSNTPSGLSMIVFSDDLDRALAAFVIANGAASAGKKVNLFFTFWGLNILRKNNAKVDNKDLPSRMFGWMMPRGLDDLKLSRMNMMGLGGKMMRGRLKSQKVDSLDTMIQTARDNGVELTACQMSMDVMGIRRDELVDDISIGGVAAYLEEAEHSNVNLFI